MIVDATRKEEQAAEGDLIVGVTGAGDVCFVSKHNGNPVDAMVFVNKSSLAVDLVKEINAVVDKALQADLGRRAKSGQVEESRAENDR